ncbi:hypothetical protein POM88_026354 [Heracleum sosnowskyi]|uniref:NFACT RNA-binding domain-containing protein n=1 Tax=Heracleum sosnowskyi TaxID=360622 RepID=A0AAD8I6P1_9APIA|nr:hypothetical protein POM88_026354 [Heracleum sosnowskyi]
MSSAHVYVRLHKFHGIDDIFEGLLEDCAQLVKENSIQGNKVNNVDVVYTPWQNLKKTASMDVGQVGFHNSKMVRAFQVSNSTELSFQFGLNVNTFLQRILC